MPVKTGLKTTEMWLTTLAILAGIAIQFLPEGTLWAKIAGAIIAGLASVGYSASRAKVKAAASLSKNGGTGGS